MSFVEKYLGAVHKPGGLFQLIRIALPLILAAAGHMLNLFADRVMMQQYSDESGAAAFPAGLTSFTLSCIFVGTIGYASSFVAQYIGAGAKKRVGTAIWQAVWLAVIGGVLLGSGWFWADALFSLFPHTESVRQLEVIYFQYLSLFSIIPLLYGALSNFWSGRGSTTFIMIVNFVVTGANIPLNYMMIYGHWGSPEMGIKGAALGTIFADALGVLIMIAMLFRKKYEEEYALRKPVFDKELFIRMVRYGFPSGIQLFLDLLAFNIFVVLLGNVGSSKIENIQIQVAAAIAFSLNNVSFTPMIGMGQAVSILVGQAVGAGNIAMARRTVRTGMFIAGFYMACMAVCFVIYPDPLIRWFIRNDGSDQSAAIALTRTFLCFIAAYTVFDGMVIVFSSAVKGAGDTKFAMYAVSGLSWGVFAIPCMIAYYIFHANVYVYWAILVTNVVIMGTVFAIRYYQGKWRSMHVIEDQFAKAPAEDERIR